MSESRERARELGGSTQKDIIHECQKNIASFYGYFSQNLRIFREDRLFYMGEQWPDWAIKIQQEENKPYLVINLIKPIIRTLIGAIRTLDPQLMLTPRDTNFADPKKLEMYIDILRGIAYNSDSNNSYSTAAENMMTGGWGVCRVGTRYKDPKKFDQELYVQAIPEASNVFFDPDAREKSKCDSKWQGIYDFMSKEEFKSLYPHAKEPDRSLIMSGIPYFDDIITDDVVVVEYYDTRYDNETLIALSNGYDYTKEVLKKDADEEIDKYYKMMARKGLTALTIPSLIEVRTKKTKIETIECYKLNGNEVLEKYKWQSRYMPFVFFDNCSVYRDGKQWTESYVHPAQDAQRVYNFCISEACYAIETHRKERILATPQQTKGYDNLYKYPNKVLAKLPYNRDPMAPEDKPTILPPTEISMTYFKQAEMAAIDVQRTLGVPDSLMGKLPNGISGEANIVALMQGNTALQNVVMNLFVGMEQVGKICLDLIPKIYDTERTMKLRKASGETDSIVVNKHEGYDLKSMEPVYENDISKLDFDLEIRPGVSFEVQKQIEDQKLMQTISLNPEFALAGADLMASRIGTPAGYQLSKRLSAYVPPNVKAIEEGKPLPPPKPSEAEQLQLEAMRTQIKEMNVGIAEKMQKLQDKEREITLKQQEFELKQREMMLKFYETVAKTEAEISKARDEAEAKIMSSAIDLHKHHSSLNHQTAMSERQARKPAKASKRHKSLSV